MEKCEKSEEKKKKEKEEKKKNICLGCSKEPSR